jgi:predicted dehydrogenase
MSTRPYRFAVLGFGGRGQYHAKHLEGVAGIPARCIAVADPRPPTDEERARFGRAFYADYRELLAQEQELDCVVVASPDHEHVAQALAALERGLPVLLEKAVATHWEDAVTLYRRVVECRYPLFVGYNLRRFPAALALKQVLDGGELGRVQSVLAHVNTGNRWSKSVYEHYTDPPFLNLIVGKLTHDTDLIQHLFNAEAASCTATITRAIWPERPNGVMNRGDVCCISGLLSNGILFTIHLTTAGPDYERRYVVNGTGGQAEAVLHTARPGAAKASLTVWPDGQEPRPVALPVVPGGHGGADLHIHQDFMAWLQARPDQPHEPRSILTGMVVCTAALDSARLGKTINCAERLAQAALER